MCLFDLQSSVCEDMILRTLHWLFLVFCLEVNKWDYRLNACVAVLSQVPIVPSPRSWQSTW